MEWKWDRIGAMVKEGGHKAGSSKAVLLGTQNPASEEKDGVTMVVDKRRSIWIMVSDVFHWRHAYQEESTELGGTDVSLRWNTQSEDAPEG